MAERTKRTSGKKGAGAARKRITKGGSGTSRSGGTRAKKSAKKGTSAKKRSARKAARNSTTTRKAAKRKASGKRTTKASKRSAPSRSRLPALADVDADVRGDFEDSKADFPQVQELLYQALETEIGGVQVYENALRCAQTKKLREEWQEYLEQTKEHREILTRLLEAWGMDPEVETPGRGIVRRIGESLVAAMQEARKNGPAAQAELVAAECVVFAETKDHMNWELLGEVAKGLGGQTGKAVKEAHDQVFVEEGQHLYHTMGFARELWLKSLGLPALLPPPEEARDVQTAGAAARAKRGRKRIIRRGGQDGRIEVYNR